MKNLDEIQFRCWSSDYKIILFREYEMLLKDCVIYDDKICNNNSSSKIINIIPSAIKVVLTNYY